MATPTSWHVHTIFIMENTWRSPTHPAAAPLEHAKWHKSLVELHSQATPESHWSMQSPHEPNNSWPQKKSWSIEQKSSFHPFLWKPIWGPQPHLDGSLCFRTGGKLPERMGLFTSLTAHSCPSRIAWQHPMYVFWGEISSSPEPPL